MMLPLQPRKSQTVSTGPSGELMMSAGRYARNCVMTAFEMIGGVEAMAEWAEENRGDFYTKLFSKTITREMETTETKTVEQLLAELDERVVDVTPELPLSPPSPPSDRSVSTPSEPRRAAPACWADIDVTCDG